jgi:hypothetical protein
MVIVHCVMSERGQEQISEDGAGEVQPDRTGRDDEMVADDAGRRERPLACVVELPVKQFLVVRGRR